MDDDTQRLEVLMDEANVNYAQRDELRRDPPRAAALLDHALRKRNVEKPAAYALARFRRGEWPTPRGARSSRPAAYELVHRMIRGQGWDDSWRREDMIEDVERIYSKRGERLTDGDRDRLLSIWQAEALRRFPPEPLSETEVDALLAAAELQGAELLDTLAP